MIVFPFLLLLLPLSSSDFFHGRYRFDQLLKPTSLLSSEHGIKLSLGRVGVSDALVTKVLSDHEDRVPDRFSLTPFFSADVHFWFSIYTQYDSSQILIHDRDDLAVIYGVLHFDDSSIVEMTSGARTAIMQGMARRKIEDVKLALQMLSLGKTQSPLAQALVRALRASPYPPPPDKAARAIYFRRRAEAVRAQTGQRNFIEAGLLRAAPLRAFLESLFTAAEIPTELLAIAFLESSFNNRAHSRVGALGVWQFMPLVASHFLPRRTDSLDYRQNPVISTIAAIHLLRENFKILKRWDLAVTAYNSGTRHLVRARRELAHPAPGLEAIFRYYQSGHHGFASKNFYSEFIALVHVLDYQHALFAAAKTGGALPLQVSISRCSFVPARLIESDTRFLELNPHLYQSQKTYPRGTIVVSSRRLPEAKFKLIALEQMLRLRPKAWPERLNGQSCSTR